MTILYLKIFIRVTLYLCLVLPISLCAKPLNYLYINASEGNASGGHTALRFDKETYHFQHFDSGIIRIIRHASADFDYQYRYLENRTLYKTTIELDEPHYEQLRNHFNLRFLLQKQQDAIVNEININLALLNKQIQSPLLTIPGAGLFAGKVVPRETGINKAVHKKIQKTLGADFIDKQIQKLTTNIPTYQPTAWPQNSLQVSENTFLSVPYSFASRYLDSVSKLLFLQTLKANTPLNNKLYFSPEHAIFTLSTAEITQLKAFQNQLINNLLSLLTSSRPDWGSSAFVLYARILALSHSIHSGKLVLLDSYVANSRQATYPEVVRYQALFQEQKQQALAKIKHHKKRLFSQQTIIAEKSYSQFEMLANYYYERERALSKQQAIRLTGERLLPSKAIPLAAHLFPKLSRQQTTTALNNFQFYQASINKQIQTLYQYDLITRNCVTEIFATIKKAEIHTQQMHELNHLVDHHPLAFIPFSSFDSLSINSQKKIAPSFRDQQLKKMQQQENNIMVYLREFNTLTAKDYKFNESDAVFLFFTDQNIWSRPIFGSLNLLTATTVGIYGGFALPFDSGNALKNSAMGILMSLPELAFFNIRKGSYKHLNFPTQTN
ncbi:MAG: hypothetical protein GQ581_09820 [Methyloprofundus sp.]|nr:hypothetical protein [Methyloprofundus sp.]